MKQVKPDQHEKKFWLRCTVVVRKIRHIYLHLKATLLREKIMSESKGRLLERALTEL